MLLDNNAIFSDAQTQTTATSHDSTYYLDFQAADANLGGGTPIWLHCIVSSTFTSALTCTTFLVRVEHSDDASTWSVLHSTKTYDYSECDKGDDLLHGYALPALHRRYVKLKYVIGSAVLTTGKWDAYLSLEPPNTSKVATAP